MEACTGAAAAAGGRGLGEKRLAAFLAAAEEGLIEERGEGGAAV